LTAARKGMARVPARHPLAVRLRGQAARAHARLGNRERCEGLFAEARHLYDRLPSRTPLLFGKDTGPVALYLMTAYPAWAYNGVGAFAKVRVHAEEALALHASLADRDRWRSQEAMTRIELGLALAELGCPEQAAEQACMAVSSPRVVERVLSRA